MKRQETPNPVAERARLRRLVWEAERILALRVAVMEGRLTEQEAEQRIRDQ